MEGKYTRQNIDQFFNQFKKLSKSYELGKVHQLINNPNAKAKHRVKFHYKPLKFIIMTSTSIIGLSILLFWVIPNKSDDNRKLNDNQLVHSEYKTQTLGIKEIKPDDSKPVVQKEIRKSIINKDEKLKEEKPNQIIKKKIITDTVVPEPKNIENIVKSCYWPIDTTIDKNSMLIYLTNDELLNLGVYLYPDSMYYCRKSPDSSYFMSTYNAKGNKSQYNSFNFYLVDDSDTLCTKHRWGHPFYNQIDTLLPVVINISDETKILWFTPHPDIFKALPKRYNYLENIYRELICLKLKNPEHQIVNYWDKTRNQVLEEINYLTLNNEELETIGIEIFKDSISIVDPTESFKYLLDYKSMNCGTYGSIDALPPEIPNMFPTMFTDIKGLNQGTYGAWIKGDKTIDQEDVFNTLIPVLLPLSDLIKGKNYQLIMWYYPTNEFLDALPPRYRNDIKEEIENITSGVSNENSNCNYFEVCKSTLSVDNLKVYPNPTNQSVTIDFSMVESAIGKISLVNIGGSQVKMVVPNTTFLSGYNSFNVDLSGIAPGIYLVSILTDKGFKTQRLIISR